MNDEKNHQKTGCITRREFMQLSAAAGVTLAAPGLFSACSGSNDTATSQTQSRTYYFDLSGSDPDHDLYLMAGSVYQKLMPMTSNKLISARQENPFLARIPQSHITHYAAGCSPYN